jgi:hypothetical protein
MSVPIANRSHGGFYHWVAQVWQAWQRRRRTLARIGDPDELGHIARDIGSGRSEVCILAGKWPDSLDLLSRRLDQVKLDGPGLRQASPQFCGIYSGHVDCAQASERARTTLPAIRPALAGKNTAPMPSP